MPSKQCPHHTHSPHIRFQFNSNASAAAHGTVQKRKDEQKKTFTKMLRWRSYRSLHSIHFIYASHLEISNNRKTWSKLEHETSKNVNTFIYWKKEVWIWLKESGTEKYAFDCSRGWERKKSVIHTGKLNDLLQQITLFVHHISCD